jgi:hypothetical protein
MSFMTVAQLMKNRKAPGEATGYIRIRSMDKRGTERLRLGANDTTHRRVARAGIRRLQRTIDARFGRPAKGDGECIEAESNDTGRE